MHKVKFNARSEYEYINNLKVLTGNYSRTGCGICCSDHF